MTYRHATDREDHSDLAAGHVLFSAPGRTGFPVRLTAEIVGRAAGHLRARGTAAPWSVLDPCCGSGQLLTIVGVLHRGDVHALTGTDIDPEAVALARRNLDLLAPGGMARRAAELGDAAADSGRPGLAAAAASARRLDAGLVAGSGPALSLSLAIADVTVPAALSGAVPPRSVDLVIADVPHGHWSDWQSAPAEPDDGATPLDRMLDALRPVLAPGAVVAVASDKAQRPRHLAYGRLEWWQVGRRRVELLGLVDAG